MQPGIFQGKEVSLINISSAAHERKAVQGKILEFFLLNTPETAFNPWMNKIRAFFPKVQGNIPSLPPIVLISVNLFKSFKILINDNLCK